MKKTKKLDLGGITIVRPNSGPQNKNKGSTVVIKKIKNGKVKNATVWDEEGKLFDFDNENVN